MTNPTAFLPNLSPFETEIERCRHRIKLLELKRDQYKLKAKRMAIHAAYLETLVKRSKEAWNG